MTYFLSDYSTAEFAEKVNVRTYAKRDGRVISSHKREQTNRRRNFVKGGLLFGGSVLLGGAGLYLAKKAGAKLPTQHEAKTVYEEAKQIAPLTRPKYRGLALRREISKKLPELKEKFGAVVTENGRVSFYDQAYDLVDEDIRTNLQAALRMSSQERKDFGLALMFKHEFELAEQSRDFNRMSPDMLRKSFGINLTEPEIRLLYRDFNDFNGSYHTRHTLDVDKAIANDDVPEIKRLIQIWGANTNQRRLA